MTKIVLAYLKGLVHHHDGLVELLLFSNTVRHISVGVALSPDSISYHIRDDTRQQQVLLMLVRALLEIYQQLHTLSRVI